MKIECYNAFGILSHVLNAPKTVVQKENLELKTLRYFQYSNLNCWWKIWESAGAQCKDFEEASLVYLQFRFITISSCSDEKYLVWTIMSESSANPHEIDEGLV